MSELRFYVYQIVVDGVVRYIGKGSGARWKSHVAKAKRLNAIRATGATASVSVFYNRLAKAIRNGATIEQRLVMTGFAEPESYEMERAAIAVMPDGQLWNRWIEANGNTTASPELKERLSAAALKRYEDHTERARMRAIHAEVARRPDVRERKSQGTKRRWAENPDAFKRFQTAAYTPEVVARRAKSYEEFLKANPVFAAGKARSLNEHWSDPEKNAAHRAALAAAHARPEVKAKRRAYYDSPEGRANLRAAAAAGKARRAQLRAENAA